MKKLWYPWDEMRRDVNTLCREIVLDKFDPCCIVGLSRGGLLPGVMMSHWLNKPFKPVKAALRDFPEWEDYLPRKTDERVLIVDDICDSGETFTRMKSYIKGPRLNQFQGFVKKPIAITRCNSLQIYTKSSYLNKYSFFFK